MDLITPENGLTYAKGYNDYDINDFVGIIPCRPLQANEEIDGICQIKHTDRDIVHVGFVIRKWQTATTFTTEWIGSRTVGQTYKIVSRNPITKRQVKKRVYTSIEDYNKYSHDLIKRYSMYHEVEVYMLVGYKNWQLIKTVPVSDLELVKKNIR